MTASEGTNSLRTRTGELVLPISASILFHCLIFSIVMAGGLLQTPPPAAPIEIELVPPEKRVARAADPLPAPAPEIVSPPDGPEEEPDEAHFRSDRSSRAREETVKRGQHGTEDSAREEPGEGIDRTLAKPAPEPPKQPAQPTAPEPPKQAIQPTAPDPPPAQQKLPDLKSLFARPSEMLDRHGFLERKEEPKPKPGEYTALTHPGLWGPPGESGTQDYLPQIREGRFTLLNAKADLYAPFVRRVGMRVFQLFSRSFRRQIRSIFFDENPPAKAVAEDGNIHFVFSLESAVWYGRDRQTGLNAPGARWVFGAGLL
jgi:hypothetical protein